MKKIFSRRSKRHDLIAECLVESISVRLKSEINTSLKPLLRIQIKAMVAGFKADLMHVKFTQKTVTVKFLETQEAILDAKAIRAELRNLVTAVVATKSNPAPQIQAALFTTIL